MLQLRFGLGHSHQHTLAEVGEQLQISRERVRQIENEALQKLRRLDGDRCSPITRNSSSAHLT